jgi:hypothetical protein
MNNDTLHLLSTLPIIEDENRLFVGLDGLLHVDHTYSRVGHWGRAILDRLVGGYSRCDILISLESLLSRLRYMTRQVVQTIMSPLHVGKSQMRLLAQVRIMEHNLPRLRTLLAVLWVIYDDDICVLSRLKRLQYEQTNLENKLAPYIQLAHSMYGQ